MEKINSFKDCKIENLQNITGGWREKTATIYEASGNPDKLVVGSSVLKLVTNTHTWFNRDKGNLNLPYQQ